MIAIIDIGYHPDRTTVAAGIIHTWTDAELSHTYTLHRAAATAAQQYIPGEFWRRELPFILEIIKEIKELPFTFGSFYPINLRPISLFF